MMGFCELTVDHRAPMPKGYGFLRKGNVYQSGLCRRLTREEGKSLYVVMQGTRALGMRAPLSVLREVQDRDAETRDARQVAVARRDLADRSEFEAALLRLFPGILEESVGVVLDHTLKKSSGRVGRTGKLSVDEKVRLATTAHVRHRRTDYDKLLRGGMPKEKAREEVRGEIGRVLLSWGRGRVQPEKQRSCPSTETETETKTKTRKGRGLRSNTQSQRREADDNVDKPARHDMSATTKKEKKRQRGRRQKKKNKKENRNMQEKETAARVTSSTPIRKSARFQSGNGHRLEALDHFFNDEDEPIVISSDDSDDSVDSDVEMEDVASPEPRDNDEEKRATSTPKKMDEFVVYDTTDDSEDDFKL